MTGKTARFAPIRVTHPYGRVTVLRDCGGFTVDAGSLIVFRDTLMADPLIVLAPGQWCEVTRLEVKDAV